jgi:hypothetical protein
MIDYWHQAETGVCTGLTARWCPVHGDCACPAGGSMDGTSCPLHAPTSAHDNVETEPRRGPTKGREAATLTARE